MSNEKENGKKEGLTNEEVNSSSINEGPLFVLRPKRTIYWAAFILMVMITLFSVFGVILPVLETGDYASVLPASNKRIGRKICAFYMAWIWLLLLPSCLPVFRTGICYFYQNRLEVDPFLGRTRRVFLYEEIIVTVRGNYRMSIWSRNLPTWSSPLQRIKAQYWKGMGLGLRPHGHENPENVQKVLQILKDKAAVFQSKPLS